MLVNPEVINDAYKCKFQRARYLMVECKIPILGIENNLYYFAKTENLKKSLDRLPFLLKFFNL